MATRILLVEDDGEIAESVLGWLNLENYVVDLVPTAEEALALLGEGRSYDMLLLDVGLPGIDGLELLRNYRASGGQAPVILITGRFDLDVLAVRLPSSDLSTDFVTKPFDVRELAARIRIQLKRPGSHALGRIVMDDTLLDRDRRVLYFGSESVRLTNREYFVLEFLMQHPNQVMQFRRVLDALLAQYAELTEEMLAQCVRNLERKIARAGKSNFLKSIDGEGYAIVSATESASVQFCH